MSGLSFVYILCTREPDTVRVLRRESIPTFFGIVLQYLNEGHPQCAALGRSEFVNPHRAVHYDERL